MKRILITLLLAVAAVATVVLWRAWPHLFPSSDTSDLYRRYEHNDYIRATEIHNFHVNDTLSVDALLLEATTDSAWCALMVDYGIPEEMVEIYMSNNEAFVGEDKHSIIYYCIDKNDPQKRVSTKDPNGLLVLGSFSKKTLCVFMTGEKSKKDIISLTEINKLKQ
jgi:hypothetical protein